MVVLPVPLAAAPIRTARLTGPSRSRCLAIPWLFKAASCSIAQPAAPQIPAGFRGPSPQRMGRPQIFRAFVMATMRQIAFELLDTLAETFRTSSSEVPWRRLRNSRRRSERESSVTRRVPARAARSSRFATARSSAVSDCGTNCGTRARGPIPEPPPLLDRRRAFGLLKSPANRKRPAGEAGRFWGYYREERYVSLYMWIRGR